MKKLIFTVEVREDDEIEQEIVDRFEKIFREVVNLLDFCASHSVTSEIVED